MKISNYIYTLIILLTTFADARAKSDSASSYELSAELKKSGYVGECFTYEITLTGDSPAISNVRVMEYPKFPEGAKIIQGVVNNNRPVKNKTGNRETYTWTILRYYIIPETSGKMTVGEGKFLAFIPHEKVIYHDFWGARRTVEYEEVALTCKSVSAKISDLPANKSANEFSGCVGEFTVEGWFPPGKIYAGKESYAVFTISGFGSLKDLKVPNLYKLFNVNCRLKEVEQSDSQMQRDGKLYSEITLTCRFIPDDDEFEISPLCFLFFNPEKKKYEEECSDVLHWTSTSSDDKNGNSSKDAIAI